MLRCCTVLNLLEPSPTPEDILGCRLNSGMTQAKAAALVGYSLRGWQDAESGRTKLQAATWALFLLGTGQHGGYALNPR